MYRSLTFKTTTHSTWGVASAVDQHTFGATWETDDVEVDIPGDVKKNDTFKVVLTSGDGDIGKLKDPALYNFPVAPGNTIEVPGPT